MYVNFNLCKMNINTGFYLDKRYPRENKKDPNAVKVYPIKLRIIVGRKQKYYAIPNTKTNGITLEATENDWKNKINSNKTKGKLRDIKLLMNQILQEVDEVIKNMETFGFDEFRELYFKEKRSENLYDVFEEYIETLKKENRISTAQSYQCALNSLKKYDPKMSFTKVDKELLTNYERWFLSQTIGEVAQRKPSKTTVGIYTRSLRTIFNIALERGITKNYPFGKGKYTPPAGQNIKKAISMDHIKKIVSYEAENKSSMDRSRDLWVFSYFSNGMNIKDICSIKEKDIKGELETIEFVREKTKLSSRGNQKTIEVIIVPETKTIIEKWCKFRNDPENYIFPFFEKEDIELIKRSKVMQLVKTTNKYLKKLSQELQLPQVITTYHARHSFASTLKESGAPVEFISEALGHANQQTTESYLKSFSRVQKEKWAHVLRGKND